MRWPSGSSFRATLASPTCPISLARPPTSRAIRRGALAPGSGRPSAHPRGLARKLAEWEGLYRSAIGSSDWHALFSGKELLRALRGNGRFRLDATPKRLTRTPAERDLDVAVVSLAESVEINRVPQWVTELRSALLAR